ncbi:MAG: ImmA/IrrE family metallo-endopeptidase [Firmicutes bacterium]|nr:ImmA/IrrE family metallo-endopeptidase [Bacillota bacterium]NLL88822.1 ImmA/IrrE family metallo-endopeptidase [Bacillota bacterium]
MGKVMRVPVRREIWQWAIAESGKDAAEIAARYPKLEQWVNGIEHPTFKQLKDVSDFLQVPFGYLFLENPPQDAAAAEFRVLQSKLPAMSKNLKDTILEMGMRRNWMSEYRKGLGWEQLEIIARFRERSGQAAADASLARKLLQLADKWHQEPRDLDAVYNLLKKKLEAVGILVMQSGIVGTYTRRRLDINEFRAFALSDPVAPLIFINRNDSRTGRLFSLVHQYLHILLEQDDLFTAQDEEVVYGENEISRLTAEFLMPEAEIVELWQESGEVPAQIERLSKMFKVGRPALAARLTNMGLIDVAPVEAVDDHGLSGVPENSGQKPQTPNYYRTYSSRVSKAFREAVIRSAEAGQTEYTYAFKLLGVNGKSYDKVKESVMARD